LELKSQILSNAGQPTYIPQTPVLSEQDETKLKDTLSAVLVPLTEIESENILEIVPILKSEAGRRSFTQMLKQIFILPDGKRGSILLSDNSFLRMLFLINTLLSVLDMGNAADYISGKVIMQISEIVYHEVDGVKEAMDRLLHHHYFCNIEFWEEYFWDTVSRKFQKKFGDLTSDGREDFSKKEKEWLTKKLVTFRNDLLDRGLPKETITQLLQKLSSDIKIDLPEKIPLRKSDGAIPKFINPLIPEKRSIKTENSLNVLDSNRNTVNERQKSRFSQKIKDDSLSECPELSSTDGSPKNKEKKRLSYFNQNFNLSSLKLSDSKNDFSNPPSKDVTTTTTAVTTRTGRSLSGRAYEPIKSFRKDADKSLKDFRYSRRKSRVKD